MAVHGGGKVVGRKAGWTIGGGEAAAQGAEAEDDSYVMGVVRGKVCHKAGDNFLHEEDETRGNVGAGDIQHAAENGGEDNLPMDTGEITMWEVGGMGQSDGLEFGMGKYECVDGKLSSHLQCLIEEAERPSTDDETGWEGVKFFDNGAADSGDGGSSDEEAQLCRCLRAMGLVAQASGPQSTAIREELLSVGAGRRHRAERGGCRITRREKRAAERLLIADGRACTILAKTSEVGCERGGAKVAPAVLVGRFKRPNRQSRAHQEARSVLGGPTTRHGTNKQSHSRRNVSECERGDSSDEDQDEGAAKKIPRKAAGERNSPTGDRKEDSRGTAVATVTERKLPGCGTATTEGMAAVGTEVTAAKLLGRDKAASGARKRSIEQTVEATSGQVDIAQGSSEWTAKDDVDDGLAMDEVSNEACCARVHASSSAAHVKEPTGGSDWGGASDGAPIQLTKAQRKHKERNARKAASDRR